MGFDIGGAEGNAFGFDTIGATVTGQILTLEEVQQTDMDTGQPAFWNDNPTQPKMMYRVTLQTELRDDATDDGKRSVYLRGSRKPESQSSLAAVLAAVRQVTGGTELEPGGTLTLTYSGDGEAKKRGHNPPKLYTASYVRPAMNIAEPGQAAAPAAPVAPVAPVAPAAPAAQAPAVPAAQAPAVPAQAAAAAPAAPTAEQVAAVKAAGLDPAVVFAGQPLPAGV